MSILKNWKEKRNESKTDKATAHRADEAPLVQADVREVQSSIKTA